MLTRRHLLQASLGGLGIQPLVSGAAPRVGTGTDYDVILIGAGVAGLAAAAKLFEFDNDLKVLVLEARDRIGGRVYSVEREELERDAELGAQYLLHEAGNEWDVIQRLDLRVQSLAGGGLAVLPGMTEMVKALSGAAWGKVQLNSEVTEILWRDGLVGVYYQNRGLESAVTARRLICTLPAGVLRDRSPTFIPPLPAHKLQALREVPSEDAISVAMVFSEADAPLKGSEALWMRDDGRQRLRAFRAGYREEVLLEAQYRGSKAEALAGQSNTLIQMLTLRNFADAFTAVPDLEKAVWKSVVDWRDDPYSRGAGAGAASTITHLSLAESLGDTVFFAGEATADPADVGTLHGALASGERAAREVALSLNMLDEEGEGEELFIELL